MSIIESSPDSVSDERFELIKTLGAGAFAQTYKARVKKGLLDYYGTDIVALKRPLDLEKEMRLQDESKVNAYLDYVLSQMEARNIVRYFGVSVFDGRLVMVMEYIEGGSLRDKIGPIEYQKSIAVEEAVGIAIGILEGLIVLHRANLFHCDLKPENILMDGQTPKICDFNLSKIVKADELASSTGGTLPYMSPEVLGKKRGSFSSDIWSLGVTLYEMLAGKLPFYDRDVEELKKLIIGDGRHIPLRKIRSQIPEKLNYIVDKALEKDQHRRYKSAQDMRLALIDFTKRPDSQVEHEIATIDALTQSFVEQPDVLEDKLREMVSRYPEEPRGYLRLGEYLNRAQRYREAIRIFSDGLKHDQGNALLHWHIAMAYLGVGNNQDAMKNLEKAVSEGLEGNFRQAAQILLARLWGTVKGAVSQLERELVEIKENLLSSEQAEIIEAKLQAILKKYPKEPRAYQVQGEFYNRSQRYKEAISVFQQGLRLGSDKAMLNWGLAMAYLGSRRPLDAAECLESAVSLGLDPGRHRHACNLLEILKREHFKRY